MRRPFRWLIRIGIALAILFVAGLIAFTWFAYWPLEGRAESVEGLVPEDVDFVYRASWREIEDNGWLTKALEEGSIHPDLTPAKLRVGGDTLEHALDRIPEVERQIDAGIPSAIAPLRRLLFGVSDFKVERDLLLQGSVVAAGRWCSGGRPVDGPPKWREILLLTRVSGQVKFAFESMRHAFVRKKVVAGDLAQELAVTETRQGALEVDLLQVAPPRRPETCEGGNVMGPTNVWYLARVRDVIAVSNSEDLIGRFQDLGKGNGRRAIDRPGFALPNAEGGVAAAMDLVGLHSYLNRFFSPADPSDKLGTFLGKFVAIDPLDRMTATLGPLPGREGVLATADVGYDPTNLRRFPDVFATYDLAPERLERGIARLVPEKDTAAVALLRTPPGALLHAVYDSLDPEEKRQIEENVHSLSASRRRKGDTAYENVGAFLDEFASQLSPATGIAVARIPSVFDQAKYENYYLGDEPVPVAAWAILVRIGENARQEQVNAWLSDRVATLGFDPPTPVTSPDGRITYSRLKLHPQVDQGTGETHLPAEYANLMPAFKVEQGHVIFSTREDYLLKILETMRGAPGDPTPIGATKEFDAAMRSLPRESTLAVFVSGKGLRDLLWDYRNTLVRRAHPDNEYAREFRVRTIQEQSARGGSIDFHEVQRLVDAEMARWRVEAYADYVRQLRTTLDSWNRVSAAAVVLSADRNTSHLTGGASLLLTERNPP